MIFRLLKITLIGALLISLFPACTEDGTIGGSGPIGGTPQGPSISLVASAGLVSSDTDVPIDSSFTVRVSAQAGEALLRSLTVQENGTTIPFSRLQFSDPNIGANPALIVSQTSINWDITIQTPSTEGFNDYAFIIADENNQTSTDRVSINVTAAEVFPPTAIAAEEEGFFWDDAKNCPPGSRFSMLIQAEQGSALIESLTVLEDGVPISDLTRIRGNGTDFPANPWVFSEGVSALDVAVSIRTSEDGNDHTYQIVVGDTNGESAIVSIDVSAGTVLTGNLTGKLLRNQAGPAGTGGINLLTGEGTGSNDASAHIRDEGIDLDASIDSNWKRQISGVNGSVIRNLSTQPEGFSFDNIQTKEEIQNLFNTGIDLNTANDSGILVTPFVIVGDIFAIQSGTDVFLVEVTNINETPSDNDDYYELRIKF